MVAMSRGRKPAGASRATEIRERLLAWKETAERQRISLRKLAAEIGVSHQLLSFHLQRLHKWQMKEYDKKVYEITDRAKVENRPLTAEEMQRCIDHSRASLAILADHTASDMLSELRKVVKRGKLTRTQAKVAKFLAARGYRDAREILNEHLQRKNNLPPEVRVVVKSFKSNTEMPGNSAKGVPRAQPRIIAEKS